MLWQTVSYVHLVGSHYVITGKMKGKIYDMRNSARKKHVKNSLSSKVEFGSIILLKKLQPVDLKVSMGLSLITV